MDWKKQAMRRAESFLNWEDGLPLHAHDARMLAQDLKDALAEVERLCEAVRQVHAMTGRGVKWAAFPEEAATALREIHKITKGTVEG